MPEPASEVPGARVDRSDGGSAPVRGRERVRRLFRATLGRPGAGFEVYVHLLGVVFPVARAKPPAMA